MPNPKLIVTPFAELGAKNDIPESGATEPQLATMSAGWPAVTETPINEGGIPPDRKDFNGLGYLTTSHLAFLNRGQWYGFDPVFAGQIGGYPINSRLMLENGDIAQSTIPNNTNNPNLNQIGWVIGIKADSVKDDAGISQQFINNSQLIRSPEYFGAKGGNNNDQQVFTELPNKYTYALSQEYTVPVFRSLAKNMIGNNTKINVDSVNGDTTVCVQIQPKSIMSDIDFVNNPNDSKSLSYATVGSESVLTKVGFYNFDDNILPKNSWGLYLENKNNITLDSPKFGNNGLSDIAIIDNVSNIMINNATNVTDNGVYLDIEPNGAGNVSNININGGNYRKISVLENSFNSYGIKGVNIVGATVGELELRGGETSLIGCKLGDVTGNWYPSKDFAGNQNEYLCNLKTDCLNVGVNLIKDSKVIDFSDNYFNDPNSYWEAFKSNNSVSVSRGYTVNDGSYLKIDGTSGDCFIHTREKISIPNGTTHISVNINYDIVNSPSNSHTRILFLYVLDSGGTLIDTISYKGGRVPAGDSALNKNEVGVFKLPSTYPSDIKIQPEITCQSGSSVYIREIGLYLSTIVSDGGNFNQMSIEKTDKNASFKRTVPLDANITSNTGHVFTSSVLSAKVGMIVSARISNNTSCLINARVISDGVVSISLNNFSSDVIPINTPIFIEIRENN